jgi:hypothetical protein
MFDDDAARRALQTLTDEPAPPVTTTVEQVLRRGRKRLLAQRASAVAGVVAVVAAIGVGAVLLRSDNSGVRVADTTPPPTTQVSMPLPGWTPAAIPADGQHGAEGCKQPFVELPPEADVSLMPQTSVLNAFVSATKAVTGHPPLSSNTQWLTHSEKHDQAPRGYVNLEVPMSNGNGQLQLEALRFGGTPEQMANASITVYGQCGKPYRTTLADGTILQIYPLDDRDTKAPSQHVQIYQPNGRAYVITSAGWSEDDMVPINGDVGGMTLGGGRGDVPVNEAQLANIAMRFVANLT